MNVALIVFAGTGSRIKSEVPKQFIKIKDMDMVVHAIKKFDENPHIDEIILVTSKDYLPYVESYADKFHFTKIVKVVEGGKSRQESVRLGLLSVDYNKNDKILIHDGDRPLVTNAIINQCIDLLDEYDAVCPAIEVEENHPQISASGRKKNIEGKTVDIQTPQAFKFDVIKTAHLNKMNEAFDDDIGLVEKEIEVKYFKGEKDNFKVTQVEDLEFLRSLLEVDDEKDN